MYIHAHNFNAMDHVNHLLDEKSILSVLDVLLSVSPAVMKWINNNYYCQKRCTQPLYINCLDNNQCTYNAGKISVIPDLNQHQ